jgi:hypothetical protein
MESESERAMKPRHTAALALVVWYLISPPLGRPKTGNDYVDDGAPYYKWAVVFAFDDLDQCQERRDLESQRGEDTLKNPPPGEAALWALSETESECIANTDPRLKIPAGLCDSGCDYYTHPQLRRPATSN